MLELSNGNLAFHYSGQFCILNVTSLSWLPSCVIVSPNMNYAWSNALFPNGDIAAGGDCQVLFEYFSNSIIFILIEFFSIVFHFPIILFISY